MSIFTRREIQGRIDSLVEVVGRKKLRQIVNKLNIKGNESDSQRFVESIAAVWEIVILSAFARSGEIKYEMKISNGRTPDFLFSRQGVSFIGDVFAVSDYEQHKKNPAEEFFAIVVQLWGDFGFKGGGLSYRIEAIDIGPPPPAENSGFLWPLHISSRLHVINRGPVKRLLLPPVNELGKYLPTKIRPFFEDIRRAPEKTNYLIVDEQYDPEITVRFSIAYSPQVTSFVGTYPSYTQVYDIDSHVLWRRLIEKNRQFAGSIEETPRILVVCDAGCQAFRHPMGGGVDYQLEEIFDHFWRRPIFVKDEGWSWVVEKNISAAVTISIESNHAGQLYLDCRFHRNPYGQSPMDEKAAALMCTVLSKLPPPNELPRSKLRGI
jgi:hypothetical protein